MSKLINLNGSDPAAAAGYMLGQWQRSATSSGTDPVSGAPYYDTSVEVPNSGGVSTKTANYTAVAGDNGTLLSFNSGSAVTLMLPATPPFAAWRIAVQSIGAGALTINRNGLTIDGAAANLSLTQNSGLQIFTDGTNYFTERGVAVDTSSFATKSGVQQESYIYAADTGTANAYAVTLSPAPSIIAGSVVVFTATNSNTGASTLAVNGGTATAIKKQASTALSSGDIVAGQIVAVFYDGTNWQMLGSSGGGSATYYGNSYVNSSSTFTTVILGSAPISGSVSIFIDGTLVSPGTYTLSGTSVTLGATYFGSHTVVATWATTNSTPGNISLSSTGAGNPVLRGSGIQYATGATITVSWPSGTVSGDLAVIFIQSAYNITTPSGWTANDNHSGGTVNGVVISKILTSADISTGSVAISLAGAYGATAAIATFVGNTAGIRETVVNQSNGASTTTVTMTSTSGSVTNTDTALYFGAARDKNGTVTINRGTSQRTSANTQSSGSLYAETLTASGAVAPTVTYPATITAGYYQSTVIVKGI